MAIRFKITTICSSFTKNSEDRVVCREQEIPIREWEFSPEVLNIRWVESTPIPSSELITIIFPELEALPEYINMNLRNVKYRIENTANSDFIELHSQENLSEIPIKNDGKVQCRVSFKNFNLLTQNQTRIELKCQVLGTLTEAGTTYEKILEERRYTIQIEKVTNITEPYITTNKNEYFITYIKSTQELLGDTQIGVHVHNFRTYKGFFGLTERKRGLPIYSKTYQQASDETYKEVPIIASNDWQRLVSQEIPTRVTLFHDKRDIKNLSADITVHLTVKDNHEGIDVDKADFYFKLFHHKNEQATGTFNILNHTHQPFVIEKSDWITLHTNGNEVSFVTTTSQELKTGTNIGFIKIISGNFFKIVNVQVVVEKIINSTLQDINFCLDPHHIIVQKINPKVEFLKMKLQMQLVGYDKKEQNIEQIYEYVFFNNQVILYPGQEIQDFFSQISHLESLHINETSVMITQNLFRACWVQISLIQYDTETIYKEEIIGDFYFLPGQKPKAYPYLTNGTIRRTYTDSLICISALQEAFLGQDLGRIAGNLVDNSQINTPRNVVHLSFRRFVADLTYGSMNIIKKATLELHPITNPQQTIDVIFQNQNFCPDWFTFSGEWELHGDLTHTLSENIQNGRPFKAHAHNKQTLKINTGWILEEEIPVLTELMLSPLCFAKMQGGWKTLIPISKKALIHNSLDNVRSFVVEFQCL